MKHLPSFLLVEVSIKTNRMLLEVKGGGPAILQGHRKEMARGDLCIDRGIPRTEITGIFLKIQTSPPDNLRVRLQGQCDDITKNTAFLSTQHSKVGDLTPYVGVTSLRGFELLRRKQLDATIMNHKNCSELKRVDNTSIYTQIKQTLSMG